MKAYKAFLIDLDGTIYHGTEPIPEAIEFVNHLKDKGFPFLYVTNNSTATPEKVANRLRGMGAPATAENVLTTSQAAARYMAKEKPGASVYFLGEEGLQVAIKEAGLTLNEENPDYVTVGLDRQVTYEKFTKACLAVRRGAKLLSTNPDVALPTEKGLAPGNGALTALVSTSTGQAPVFIGKPEPIIIEEAVDLIGGPKSDILLIGDNYHTDIKAGLNAGVDTLFVSTGVTLVEELDAFDEKPTYHVTSLKEWTL